MHFKISLDQLHHHLQVAARALGKSETDSAIELILDKETSVLNVQATNGMFTISSICDHEDLEIIQEGKIRVQGKLFIDVIRSLKVSQVELRVEEGQLKIQADKIDLALKTIYEPEPYTVMLPQDGVEIDVKVLNSVTSKVEKAASRDESRPILTGVLITVEDNILRMIATDSYRLAVAQTDVETGNWEALVPVKSLLELIKLANTTGNTKIHLDTTSNILKASTDNAIFNCRLIDGTLPNYETLVPKDFAHNFHFNVHDLAESVNMLSIISGPGNPIGFYFQQEEGIKLAVDNGDKGQANEEISKEWKGENLEIGFDPVYLKDGLDLMGEKASLKMVDSMRPSLLVDPDDPNFLYLIMPLRLK